MDTATPKTKGPSPRRRIVVLRSSQKFLWIFGNAVQDITVEADVERLARELGNIGEIIHLAEQGPQIVAKLWLKTQIGLQEFAVCVELEGIKQSSSGLYLLEGGKKYTLVGDIVESHKEIAERSIFLPCENLSWGGGGANLVTCLRALAPSREVVPIKYTDIAMSRSLPTLMRKFENITLASHRFDG